MIWRSNMPGTPTTIGTSIDLSYKKPHPFIVADFFEPDQWEEKNGIGSWNIQSQPNFPWFEKSSLQRNFCFCSDLKDVDNKWELVARLVISRLWEEVFFYEFYYLTKVWIIHRKIQVPLQTRYDKQIFNRTSIFLAIYRKPDTEIWRLLLFKKKNDTLKSQLHFWHFDF